MEQASIFFMAAKVIAPSSLIVPAEPKVRLGRGDA
jgi:hypothetical protein